MIKHIKLNKGTPLKFITENSLRRMLFEMIDKKYIPDVNYENKKINSLYFKVDKVKYSIQPSINEDDTDHSILENEHKIYNDANEEFYKWIINNKLISKMSEQVKLIENEYRNGPLSGYFESFSHCVTYNAADRNKSYTSLL